MGKPDGLSRRSGVEKSEVDAKVFEEGQLLDLGEDENDNEYNADNIELGGIAVSKWDKCKELWLVVGQHGLEVLLQHYDT